MPTGVGPNEFILDNTTNDIKSTAKRTLADYLSTRTKGGTETFTPSVQGGGDYTYAPPRSNAYPIDSTATPTEIGASADYTSPESTQSAFADATDLANLRGSMPYNTALTSLVSLDPSARTGMSTDAKTGHAILENVATSTTTANAEAYNTTSGIFSESVNSPDSIYGNDSGVSPYNTSTTVDRLGTGYTGTPGVPSSNSVDLRSTDTIRRIGGYLSSRTRGEDPTPIVDAAQAGGLYRNNSTTSNAYPIDSSAGVVEIGASAVYTSPESTQPVFADATDLANLRGSMPYNMTLASLISLDPSARTGMSDDAKSGHEILENVANNESTANSQAYNTDSGVFSESANSPDNAYGQNGENSTYNSYVPVDGLGTGYTGSPGVPGRNSVDFKSTEVLGRLGSYLSSRTRGEDPTPIVDAAQAGGLYRDNGNRANVYPVQGGEEYAPIPADASNLSSGQFATDLTRLNGDPALRSIVKMEPATDRLGDRNGNTVLNSDAAKQVVATSVLTKNRFTAENKFTSNSYKTAMPAPPSSISGQGDSLGSNIFETMRRAALASMLNAAGGSSGPGSGLFTIGDMSTDEQKLSLTSLGRITKIGGDGGLSDSLGIEGGSLGRIPVGDLRPAGDRAKITPPSPTNSNYFENIYGRATQFSDLPNPDTQTREMTFSSAEEGDTLGNTNGFYTGKSYGQLNSYLQSFSGGGTLSLVPLALLAYVALFVAVVVVSLVISILVGKLPRPNYQKSNLPLGAERGPSFGTFLFDADSSGGASLADILPNVANIISKILGVMQPYEGPIIVSYFLSALEGALGLIGVNTDSFTAGNIGSALVTSVGNIVINFGVSPGYYLILIREISRDLDLLAGPQQTEAGLLGIIDGIRSLKLLRFVDTCARLGIVNSQAKNSDNDIEPDSAISSKVVAGGDVSSPAGLQSNWYEVAQRRVSRSKETDGSRRLAWSHSSLGYTRTELVTRDLLRALTVNKIVSADGNTEPATESLRRIKARKVVSQTGRIDPATRRRHEELLEAEYMPFYFHDLRTNEILSFHAFLSTLSDSFTSNYNSVSGFGRMDPVQIYKDTTRSISFSFAVVATSPDDHEQMWYSVNKLVNMIYPQWSEGDTITGADGQTFIQPFSQTVAASPMIRLRIGDVIHSNYSRFALGRLFGLDKQDAKVNATGTEGTKAISLQEGVKPSEQEIYTDTEKGLADGSYVQTSAPSASSNDLNTPRTIVVENSASFVIAATAAAKLFPTRVSVQPGKYDSYEENPSLAPSGQDLGGGNSKKLRYKDGEANGAVVGYKTAEKAKTKFAYAVVELYIPKKAKPPTGKAPDDVVDYVYITVPSDELQPAETTSLPLPALPLGDSSPKPPTGVDAYTQFLDPKNNPIVRSFEEGAGGRGLAGFISQLGVEYGETENTWNVERGSRAPNMVKFSVTFLPIHDIPMGLASDGSARSMAYPVGKTTRMRFMPDILNEDEKLTSKISGLTQNVNTATATGGKK